MKKTFCLLMAGFLVLLSISACGDKVPAVEVIETTDSQPEYLSFFSVKSLSGKDVIKYWNDLFTEMYSKQVYINFEGADYYAEEGLSYRELLEKRLESSAPDDLYIINAEDVLEFGQKNYWMDLSDMDFINNLSEAALYQSTYNGKVFSLPLSMTGFGFAWNLNMLEKYELSVPQNLDEFLEVCEVLREHGILPYGANRGYALTVPAMCAGLSDVYKSEDTEEIIASLNSGKIPISEYMQDGFELLDMMIKKGYMNPEQALTATPLVEDVEMFLAQECGFICIALGEVDEFTEKSFRIEITGVPVLEEGSTAVFGANKRLCVNPESRHMDTVLEFMEMVGTKEALAESAKIDIGISSAEDGGTSSGKESEKLAQLLQQKGQIPNQDFSLHFNTWENIRDIGREICGGADVQAACDMLDKKQQEELIKYGIS